MQFWWHLQLCGVWLNNHIYIIINMSNLINKMYFVPWNILFLLLANLLWWFYSYYLPWMMRPVELLRSFYENTPYKGIYFYFCIPGWVAVNLENFLSFLRISYDRLFWTFFWKLYLVVQSSLFYRQRWHTLPLQLIELPWGGALRAGPR